MKTSTRSGIPLAAGSSRKDDVRAALLASIVDSSDDAIMSETLEGVFTSWNMAAQRMFGYSAEEIIGKPVSLLADPGADDEMVAVLERIRTGERVDGYETTRRGKDGRSVEVSLTVSPMLDADGTLVGVSSIARDITERERAEEQARIASQYVRGLIEASLDPLVTISAEGKITDVNEATIRVTGADRLGLVGTDFSDYFTEPEKAREGYQQVFAQGFVTDYPLTIRHMNGGLTDVLYNASVYKDAGGNVLGVFAAARDVTAQKRAEQALKAAEDRYRTLFQQSPDGVLIADPESAAFLEFNDAAHRQLGYTREEFARLRVPDLEAKERPEETKTHIERVLREGRDDFETLHRTKAGEIRNVQVTTQTIEVFGRPAFHAVFRDVTERKRTEDALRHSERQLAIGNRIADAFITVPDQEVFGEVLGVILEAADSDYGAFGYIDQDGALVVPSMTREIWDQCKVPEKGIVFPRDTWGNSIWCRAIREKRALYSNEASRVPEGHIPIARNISLPIMHRGEPIGLIQVANREADYEERDVALLEVIADRIAPILHARLERGRQERAREQVEDEVRRRNHELSVLYAISRAAAESLDLDARLNRTIDATLQALQIEVGSILLVEPTGDALTMRVQRGLSEDMADATRRLAMGEGVTGRAATEQQQIIIDVADYPPGRLEPAVAREGYQTFSATPLQSAGRVVGVLSLATRRVRAFPPEEKEMLTAIGQIIGVAVQNAQLFDAVTELNAGLSVRAAELQVANKELEAFSYSVSHDLHAPLRAIDGFSRILLQEHQAEVSPEGRRLLHVVRDGAEQMGRLIDDLLAFSRLGRQSLHKQDVSSVGLVQGVLDDLQAEREGRNVSISVAELPACEADPALLRQVFVNLLSNALKYTRTRDPAVIEVGHTTVDGVGAFFIRDNGVGFDMRYAGKLFGVFQRLHRAEEYEGTGVGLAVAQRIVRRHGGRIWADATKDRGATFWFTVDGGASDG